MPRELDLPSPEEDATIQRGIEQDADSPELGDEFFKDARPASAVLPRAVYADLTAPTRDNPETADKVRVMLPVDQDVFERLKESGPDWQARMDEALRRLVER